MFLKEIRKDCIQKLKGITADQSIRVPHLIIAQPLSIVRPLTGLRPLPTFLHPSIRKKVSRLRNMESYNKIWLMNKIWGYRPTMKINTGTTPLISTSLRNAHKK